MLSNSGEIFVPVKGFEDYYIISNYGRLYSFKRKRFVGRDRHGYVGAQLYGKKWSGQNKSVYIHRLVAEAFLPNPDNLPEINHKDENKKNNHVDNLEWCTSEYNHAYGTRVQRAAEKHKKQVVVKQHGMLIGVFDSIREAAEHLKVGRDSISDWLNGTKKSKNGYTVERIQTC